MKRIFLLLTVLTTFAFSAIDECKTDVYFGNGILTTDSQAERNSKILRTAIIEKFGLDYFQKKIGKVSYAYNTTHGEGNDLLESALQKLDWDWLTDYFSPSHKRDVTTQVNQYEASIRLGHRVLVVAHSQGNLFAYEAYRKLPGWMREYLSSLISEEF